MAEAILEQLVEHILLELLEAQNASNEASAKLAESYLRNGKNGEKIPNLEFFPVPNSSIKAFDFSLRFGLENIGFILSEEVKLELNNLIDVEWLKFLDNLVQNGAMLERRKRTLLTPPRLDFSEMKSKVTASGAESISAFLEKEIILLFVKQLPPRIQRRRDKVSKSALSLGLARKIEPMLFQDEKEQSIPLPKVKAVFDLSKLDGVSGEVICNINIHVEMRNFASAYYNNAGFGDDNDDSNPKRLLTIT